MKLYTTKRSPFGRKVQVMAIEKGLKNELQIVIEDMQNKSEELLKANPLGAVPTLVLDNGKGLYDSPVIADYIDSLNRTPRLIPGGRGKKNFVLRVSALADGMIESAIKIFYERMKDADRQDPALIKKHIDALMRCFKALEKDTKKMSKELTMAPIAVGSAIGYINFRLKDLEWQKKAKKLAAWYDEFSQRPSMKETEPRE